MFALAHMSWTFSVCCISSSIFMQLHKNATKSNIKAPDEVKSVEHVKCVFLLLLINVRCWSTFRMFFNLIMDQATFTAIFIRYNFRKIMNCQIFWILTIEGSKRNMQNHGMLFTHCYRRHFQRFKEIGSFIFSYSCRMW